jgi:hypothetical protein
MQCYCSACDKPASACEQWGDGLSLDDHCNATCRANSAKALVQQGLNQWQNAMEGEHDISHLLGAIAA